MKLNSLFNVEYGHGLALNALEPTTPEGGVAFVSRSAQNNGIAAWVKPIPGLEPHPAGALTVSLRSRNHAVATFLQPRPFYTAYHLFVLTPKRPMTDEEKLWWAMCIEANRYRYHFGRQANRTLPTLEVPDAAPSWVGDASLSAYEPRTTQAADLPAVSGWAEFTVDALFEPKRGTTLLRREMTPGDTPYISASAQNNGITARVSAAPMFEAGSITVSNNGSVGESFYQPERFLASADVTILRPRTPISESAALFVCTILMTQRPRWNYGRKWSSTKLAATRISLPADAAGNPDWAAMARYIESLPLSEVLGLGSNADPMTALVPDL